MHVIETASGEKFRVQDGTIIFGKTSGGVLVPILVGSDGSIATGASAGGIADGADVAEGSRADAAVSNPTASATVIALLKGILLRQYSGVPSNFVPATAEGTVFTLAAGEVGFIQNLSAADSLAVKRGASASTNSFNHVLQSGVAADDGHGGSILIDDWIGIVSVAKIGTAARYIAWKQAPA